MPTTRPPARTRRAALAALAAATLPLLAAAPPVAASTASAAPVFTVPDAPIGEVVRFRGTVRPGSRVVVQRLTAGRGWVRTATARAARDGRYIARWRADELGRFTVRVLVRHRGARVASAARTRTQVTIFRRAKATWYGPGLYGNTTACGQTMTEDLMGVAHKRLPCGTPVEVFHGGRSVVVPVVDRGPYAHGAHYDLTAAVARTLRFDGVAHVGVLPRRGETMTPPPAPDAATMDASGGVRPAAR